MNRPGTAVLVGAALGAVLLFIPPAEGAPRTALAPRVKGVVISRSAGLLIIDQVLLAESGQPRTAQVVISPRTRVAGRRSAAPDISVHDLIRADGIRLPDGSLEALHIEIVLTAEEISRGRPAQSGFSSLFWDWVLRGSVSIPLR
jgi:hypothetical protein